MKNTITHVAMDTHKKEHKVALHYPGEEQIVRFAIKNTVRDIKKMVSKIKKMLEGNSEHHVELGKAKPVLKLNSETDRHELPSRYSKLPTIGTQSSLSPKPVKQQTMSGSCLLSPSLSMRLPSLYKL